jgi:16S rRNA (adenine1518-N6/adenine1519-N6)-dimethyltransferase
LEPYGIRPVHDRGQHFLLDDGVVEKMVEAAGIKSGDHVLEIGPGPGILTEKLLYAGAQVTAVELDLKLRELLAQRFGVNENFTLLDGDVLAFSNAELSAHGKKYKLVANLPYGITSEVFKKFLLESPRPESISVMIQREVADRVLAKRGDMSNLAVMVQTYADVSRVVNVPRGVFLPPPKVDSAVIHMKLKSDAEMAEFFGRLSPERYFAVVRAGFAERRKQLKNTLRTIENDENRLKQAFLKAGIPPASRPEELSITDWRALVDALTF